MRYLITKYTAAGKEWRLIATENDTVEVWSALGVRAFPNVGAARKYTAHQQRLALDMRQFTPGQQVMLPTPDGSAQRSFNVLTNDPNNITLVDTNTGEQMQMPHMAPGQDDDQNGNADQTDLSQPNQKGKGIKMTAPGQGIVMAKNLIAGLPIDPERMKPCPVCHQTGEVYRGGVPERCDVCEGSTWVFKDPMDPENIKRYDQRRKMSPLAHKVTADMVRTPYYCKHDQTYLLPDNRQPRKVCPSCGMVYTSVALSRMDLRFAVLSGTDIPIATAADEEFEGEEEQTDPEQQAEYNEVMTSTMGSHGWEKQEAEMAGNNLFSYQKSISIPDPASGEYISLDIYAFIEPMDARQNRELERAKHLMRDDPDAGYRLQDEANAYNTAGFTSDIECYYKDDLFFHRERSFVPKNDDLPGKFMGGDAMHRAIEDLRTYIDAKLDPLTVAQFIENGERNPGKGEGKLSKVMSKECMNCGSNDVPVGDSGRCEKCDRKAMRVTAREIIAEPGGPPNPMADQSAMPGMDNGEQDVLPEGANPNQGRVLTRHEIVDRAEQIIRDALAKGIKPGVSEIVEHLKGIYGNSPDELYQGTSFAWQKIQYEDQGDYDPNKVKELHEQEPVSPADTGEGPVQMRVQ